MSATAPKLPVCGRIDTDGRLVEADDALAGLHARAGGAPGGVVAVPQLASLARLTRRLGIAVARPVIAADGEQDLDLWVRARLDGDQVEITIAEWRVRPAAPPADAPEAEREHDFLRANADWLWETDQALRLTALSSAAAALIAADGGAPPLGTPLARVFRLIETDENELPIVIALGEQARFEDQLVALRGAGTRYRLAGLPLLDGRGGFAGFRGVGVALEPDAPPADPEEAAAFAARLDRALRLPLDRIVANAEAIRARSDGPLRDDYAGYAADIATAGRHLLGLVDDLVDLEAIERPDFRPPAVALDLADLARRAAGLLAVRAADKSIIVERPAEDARVPASGDFRRTLQVLVNLVGNAVRYAPAGSTVRVTATAADGIATVSVADAGRGIAAEDQQRIFEKFERLGASEPGSGLGLYIARRLAHAMAGDIGVESTPGAGATFTLTLPAGG